MEENLADSAVTISNIAEYIYDAVSFSSKLNTIWASGGIGLKEDLQKLVYPSGIYFDCKKDAFRTEEMNFIFSLIDSISISLEPKEKTRNALTERFSPLAEREGFEPPEACTSTVFKTAAFDRSAISPRQIYVGRPN